jgi:hypothetical protein
MVAWPLAGVFGKAEHIGGEGITKQSCSPHGGWETEMGRKGELEGVGNKI